jgi:hypothetical protein
MSGESNEAARARAEHLQAAFDERAHELDLRLEPAAAADPRSIGVAFVFTPMVAYDIDPAPNAHDAGSDDQKIREILLAHESLTPEQYRQGGWREHLHEPHNTAAREGLIKVDQGVIDEWLASSRFTDFQAQYPWKKVRDVELQNVQITYLGPHMASASYRVVEKLANGGMIGGNATTVLSRLAGCGWRGVVITKGGREELHPAAKPPARPRRPSTPAPTASARPRRPGERCAAC